MSAVLAIAMAALPVAIDVAGKVSKVRKARGKKPRCLRESGRICRWRRKRARK